MRRKPLLMSRNAAHRLPTVSTIGAACLGLLMVSSAAAHTPTVEITKVGGVAVSADAVSLELTLPASVDVEIAIQHGDQGNFDATKDLTLFVKGPGEAGFSQEGATLDPDTGNPSCGGFSGSPVTTGSCTMPWSIDTVGTYTVRAEATHGNSTGSDEAMATITEMSVTVEFAAAPAIFNTYGDADLYATCEVFGKKWRGEVNSYLGQWQVEDGVHRKHAFEDANDLDGWKDLVLHTAEEYCTG